MYRYHILLTWKVGSSLYVALYVDIVPNRTSPPPRRPPARRMARERNGPEAHRRPSLLLALGEGEDPAASLEERAPGRPCRCLRHRPLPSAWRCGRGAGNPEEAGTGPADRPEALSPAGPGAGPDRGEDPGTRFEAGPGPRAGRGHRDAYPGRDPRGQGHPTPGLLEGWVPLVPEDSDVCRLFVKRCGIRGCHGARSGWFRDDPGGFCAPGCGGAPCAAG